MKVFVVWRHEHDDEVPSGGDQIQGFFQSLDAAVAAIVERGDEFYSVCEQPFDTDTLLPHVMIPCTFLWPVQGVRTDQDGKVL